MMVSIMQSIMSPIMRAMFPGGGGLPAMPDGAIGIWYADEYQATPRKVIPNSQSEQPVSQNLLTFPRRKFNDVNWWNKHNTTITDGNDESIITMGSGDAYVFPIVNPVLVAGDYTMCVTARRNGGTDQNFRMSFLQAGVDSGTFTATDTNQDFSFTATCGAGAQQILALRTVGGAASDLIVSRIALYAGTEDIGEPAEFGGHMILGDNQFDSRPDVADGIADLTADGAYGLAQWETDLSLSEYTVIAVAKRTNDAAYYSAIMSRIAYTGFGVLADRNKAAYATFGGQELYNSYAGFPSGLKLFGNDHVVLGHRFGTRRDMFLNDTRLVSAPIGSESLPASVLELLFSAYAGVGNTGGYEYVAWALYPTALSDADYRTAKAALAARAGLSGVTIDESARFLVSVGDSITSPTDSYPNLYTVNASPKVFSAVYATAGHQLTNLNAQASIVDAVIPPNPGSNKYILSIMIGTNDLTNGLSVIDYLAGVSAYIAARLAAGYTDIVLCTLLPRNDTTFKTLRASANPGLVAMAASNIHIADIASDALMGADGDEANGTYYADGTHPTAAGQARIEAIFRAVVDAI